MNRESNFRQLCNFRIRIEEIEKEKNTIKYILFSPVFVFSFLRLFKPKPKSKKPSAHRQNPKLEKTNQNV